jgi:hypothetical protein
MSRLPIPGLPVFTLLALGLLTVISQDGRLKGAGAPAQDAPPNVKNPAARSDRPRGQWMAFGHVTDQHGQPMAGVEIRAYCGAGTLRQTGTATSGATGRYELEFGPGVLYRRGSGALQAATILLHKPGYFEENLARQGNCLAADAEPTDAALKQWGGRKDRVFVPDHPLELNFVMRPSGRVAGKIVDEKGRPLAGYSVSLTGAELPPSSNAVCWASADERGRFVLEDIPTNFRFQFEIRMSESKPPWEDSWASAALRFEKPASGDVRAWFGDQEIRVQELVIRVMGKGVHGQTAVPVAGNIGVLDLTPANPTEVLERNDRLVVATSAILTLRNAPPGDVSQSLISQSVPAPLAYPSATHLARTRPNAKGEFEISFENPHGSVLVPGEHQVIFQVFVGASKQPIREKIFRQLEARRAGSYRVPVKIAPEWIADSRVSITFLTIQPDHDKWVRSFFHEGRGTRYKGMWTGDDRALPAIPFEP